MEGQTYYQITDTGGTQSIGGNNVTITHWGASCPRPSPICSSSLNSYCNSSCSSQPNRGLGGWVFSFSSPVASARAYLQSINYDNTAEVLFNGSQYYITSANLSALPCPSKHCTVPDSTISCAQLTTEVNSLQSAANNLHIYPNPNKGIFTVWGTFVNCGETILEIINPLGQFVYKDDVKIENDLLNRQINMNNLPTGVYICC